MLRKFRSLEADVEADGIARWAAVADELGPGSGVHPADLSS